MGQSFTDEGLHREFLVFNVIYRSVLREALAVVETGCSTQYEDGLNNHALRYLGEQVARNHIVITGTGRSGTTFVVELLTHLGLDTGFSGDEIESRKYQGARAGLEHDIRQDDCPFIVKSPWFCDYADEVMCRDDIVIEHVLIPMRDLYGAAESRRFVTKREVSQLPLVPRLKHVFRPVEFAGGLWHTRSNKPGRQEEILQGTLYRLMLALSDTTSPVTLMRYPRIVRDCSYLFGKLKPILPGTTYESFCVAFSKTVRPELVHRFGKNDW